MHTNRFASSSPPLRRRRVPPAHDRRAAAWRCGWCSRDRHGIETEPAPLETTGICEPCLAERRAVGFRQTGPGFVVWDEDAREAARWADELRAAGAWRRRAPREVAP